MPKTDTPLTVWSLIVLSVAVLLLSFAFVEKMDSFDYLSTSYILLIMTGLFVIKSRLFRIIYSFWPLFYIVAILWVSHSNEITLLSLYWVNLLQVLLAIAILILLWSPPMSRYLDAYENDWRAALTAMTFVIGAIVFGFILAIISSSLEVALIDWYIGIVMTSGFFVFWWTRVRFRKGKVQSRKIANSSDD